MVLGVDYQPGGQDAAGTGNGDPLSNVDACLRDAALMQNLGVNTIRIYNLDPTENHDECASIFNAVGIYMILDVNSPLEGQYIDRSDPKSTYTSSYLQHVFTVIEAFKNYPNVLGFFAGNEIINDEDTAEDNPQYIRAVQRDMKNYIRNNADRTIPVGYSAADVREILDDTWAYLQCQIDGEDDMSRSDFFGLNSYSWCGSDSSYTISGYDTLVELFGSTTIPVFFSEYGCNDPSPRVFDEVPTLYGPKMTVMSGGLVYEWTQEEADYGIIQADDNGGGKLLVDYNTLLEKFEGLDVNLLTSQNNTATSLTPPTCSSSLIKSNSFSTVFDIPDTPSGAEGYINNGISNPPSGKIIDVKTTTVPGTVKGIDGSTIEGLSIKIGSDSSNYPGKAQTVKSTGASGSSSSSSDNSGSSNSASSVRSSLGAGGLVAAVVSVALSVVAFAM